MSDRPQGSTSNRAAGSLAALLLLLLVAGIIAVIIGLVFASLGFILKWGLICLAAAGVLFIIGVVRKKLK